MKRFICILISCLLILNSTFFCYADAGTGLLTVAGGTTLIGAGLTGEAVVSALLPPVAVAAALALTAYGADIYISEKAQAEGVTKQTYIETKLLEYAEIEDNAIMTIANGISVTADGVYQWTNDALNTFSDFVDSLKSSNDIVDRIPISDSATLGNYDLSVLSSLPSKSGKVWLSVSGGASLYWVICNGSLYAFGSYPWSLNQGISYSSTRNGWYWRTIGANDSSLTFPTYNTSIYNILDAGKPTDVNINTGVDTVIVGNGITDLIGVDVNSLANGIGNDVIGIGDGVLEGVSVANPAIDGAISVGEYAGVVAGVLEGVGSVSVPSVGSIAIPQGLSITKPRVVEKEESTPIANNGSLPVAGSLGGGVYTFDLTEIFPFCLPFDLAHLVGKFQGSPTAPHWEIPFKLEGFIDEVIVLDFEQFNGVARVFRLGEDIIFIACLIFISRKLIMS